MSADSPKSPKDVANEKLAKLKNRSYGSVFLSSTVYSANAQRAQRAQRISTVPAVFFDGTV